MVICSAEQSHEWVGQLPHADPSGSSFLQSSCHGEGDGWALHRQRAIAKNMCIPRDTVEKPCVSLGDTQSDHSEEERIPRDTESDHSEEERIPRDTLSREQKVYPR